jgi:hypothetical protein
MRRSTLAALLLAAGCASTGSMPPAAQQTSPPPYPPGATNPAVTQQTIGTTVCVPNWTESIRPDLPTRPGMQHDHFISLALGGSPTDGANLWFVPLQRAREDDRIETLLHRLVCKKPPQVTLADAQAIEIAWKRAYG